MAAIRAGKLFFGAIVVCSLTLTAAYSFAAAEEPSENNKETIPTPAPENIEPLAPATEDANLVTQQCDDTGCTFEGVPLCSPPGRFWVRSDWLMWWTSGSHLPPLVTTSPQGTALEQAGVLGQPGTEILFGNSSVYSGGRSGVRMTFGGWLDNCHRWGVEADWLTLGGQSVNYFQSSTDNPILARPFYNVMSSTTVPSDYVPHQDSELVAFPNLLNGSVEVTGNDYFESVGMTLRYNLCCNSCDEPCADACDSGCGDSQCRDPRRLYYCRTDLLLGYRHYMLGDNLSIHEDLYDTQKRSSFLVTDTFNTRNEFHGTEIGLNTELRRGRWSLGLLAKMALGNTHETAIIRGTTTTNNGVDPPSTYPVGVFASSPNSGVHPSDQFTVIPQFGVEMGYQITCRWRAFVGYDLLYWASVMRAGDQIDMNIDPRNVANADPLHVLGTATPYPAYLARQTSFWAQGINVGTELRF